MWIYNRLWQMLNRKGKQGKEKRCLEGYFGYGARETSLGPEWNAGEPNE